MISAAACLVGILAIFIIGNNLGKHKFFSYEDQRKFVHVTSGTFVASWPWLISWQAISWIGFLLLLGAIVNRSVKIFDFHSKLARTTYGDIFFALAIIACSFITTNKLFFAIAILHMSLADGLAAAVGTKHTKVWKYKLLNNVKTIIGSMTFWFVSLCILGTGLLFAHGLIGYGQYAVLLVALPPILTLLEAASNYGIDNLIVPLAVLLALRLAQLS